MIELLVVISIIALLIAILLPALQTARAAARSSTCLQRERQLAIGMAAYSADSNDMFISYYDGGVPNPKPRWDEALIYYMGKLTHENPNVPDSRAGDWHFCPVKGPAPAGLPESDEPDWIAYNQYLGWTHGNNNPANQVFTYVYHHQVMQPSKTMMLADGWWRVPQTTYAPGHFFRNLSYTADARANITKHEDAANYVFIDGHGESIRSQIAVDLPVPNKYPVLQPFEP